MMKMALDLLLLGGRLGKTKRGVGVYYCLEFLVPTLPSAEGGRECFMVPLHGKSLACFSACICEEEKDELCREDRKSMSYFHPVA